MSAPAGHPGPRRPAGAPVGPEAVRRAVLDAAADLFGRHGVQATSLRDIATAADVQLALISRYVGSRDRLIVAVFDDLAAKVVADLQAQPLESHGFGRDATAMQFTVVLSYLAVTGNAHLEARDPAANPVQVMADQIVEHYGLDEVAARLRAAQILASALGWRLFEPYLFAAAGLGGADLDAVRADLVRQHRRTGATPYPSPPDPPTRRVLPNEGVGRIVSARTKSRSPRGAPMSTTDEADVHGPIDFLLLEFDPDKMTGEAADALLDLVEGGIVQIYDLLVIVKDDDGTVRGIALTDATEDGLGSFAAFEGAGSGLIGDSDIAEAGNAMLPGTAAALLVYENTWARPFVAAARKADAQVIASARIPADVLAEVLDELES